jgi:hypothetical protein
MTELQMGLIGLGVAAVFGVFGYNKWQEMRQRKVAEAARSLRCEFQARCARPVPPAPLLARSSRPWRAGHPHGAA